jgi:hypothetical protein
VETLLRNAIQTTTDPIGNKLRPIVGELWRSAHSTLNQEWDARSLLSPSMQRQTPRPEALSTSPFTGQSHSTLPVFPPTAVTPFTLVPSLPDGGSSSMVPPYYQIPPSLPEDATTATFHPFETNRDFQPRLPESQTSDSGYGTQPQFEFFCTCGASSYTMSNDGTQSTHSFQSSLAPWGSLQPSGSVDSLNSVSVNSQGEHHSDARSLICSTLTLNCAERRVTKCRTCLGWRFTS